MKLLVLRVDLPLRFSPSAICYICHKVFNPQSAFADSSSLMVVLLRCRLQYFLSLSVFDSLHLPLGGQSSVGCADSSFSKEPFG